MAKNAVSEVACARYRRDIFNSISKLQIIDAQQSERLKVVCEKIDRLSNTVDKILWWLIPALAVAAGAIGYFIK
ncbi:MAG: hypothetical protein ACTSX6_00245 [Candidatus Heimdallarchaeaceae archaeon]